MFMIVTIPTTPSAHAEPRRQCPSRSRWIADVKPRQQCEHAASHYRSHETLRHGSTEAAATPKSAPEASPTRREARCASVVTIAPDRG